MAHKKWTLPQTSLFVVEASVFMDLWIPCANTNNNLAHNFDILRFCNLIFASKSIQHKNWQIQVKLLIFSKTLYHEQNNLFLLSPKLFSPISWHWYLKESSWTDHSCYEVKAFIVRVITTTVHHIRWFCVKCFWVLHLHFLSHSVSNRYIYIYINYDVKIRYTWINVSMTRIFLNGNLKAEECSNKSFMYGKNYSKLRK